MDEQAKIITARRAYEFRQDGLRLSVLSMIAVQEYIRQTFQFQVAQVGMPMQTFGPVPATNPPGIVFDLGTAPYPEGSATPIRFLHFEPKRVVIDIAGPSAAIDSLFAQLQAMLRSIPAPDGSAVMEEPVRVLDFSEITHPTPYNPDVLLMTGLHNVIRETLHVSRDDATDSILLVPSMRVGVTRPDEEFGGVALELADVRSFVYEIRRGTHVNEHIYYSAAPLATDAHLTYLDKLRQLLIALAQ